jgi:hypothetical protein
MNALAKMDSASSKVTDEATCFRYSWTRSSGGKVGADGVGVPLPS